MRITPLRFMGLVIGLWIGGRALVLLPGGRTPEKPELATGRSEPARHAAAPAHFVPVDEPPARTPSRPRTRVALARSPEANGGSLAEHRPLPVTAATPAPASPAEPVAEPAPGLSRATPAPGRLSVDAYVFLREGGTNGLAPGTQLGGGQVFARMTYALTPDRMLAATARLSRAFKGEGAEAAAGLRWTPFPGRPLNVFAERRVALDGGGRDAWSIFVAGGADETRIGPLLLDAYAQAGVVGARRRDMFVDGAARVGLPLGPARVGAGIWGAAQPDAARLDLGPRASIRLGGNVTAALEGRIRVAGDARPGSGVALMLATGF